MICFLEKSSMVIMFFYKYARKGRLQSVFFFIWLILFYFRVILGCLRIKNGFIKFLGMFLRYFKVKTS